MIKQRSESEIRKGINHELEVPVNDAEWNLLHTWKWINTIRDGKMTPSGIAAKLVQMRKAVGPGLPHKTNNRATRMNADRSAAVARLVARDASEDFGVTQFRKEALGGCLLQPHEQEAWIRKQAEHDGSYTVFLSVPLPKERHLKFIRRGSGFEIFPTEPFEISSTWPAVATEVNDLAFLTAKGKMRRMPISATGTLERLRILSEMLSSRYNWGTADATTFILTNIEPVMPPFEVREQESAIPALSRLHLIVDPALSPRKLSTLYSESRDRRSPRRYRELSEKHRTLALFASSRPHKETYGQSMAEWNRQYPKWAYTKQTNFGRDAKVAQQRTMGFNPLAGRSDIAG